MKILKISKGGFAEELGLLPGDDIKSINGRLIKDTIDFQFWGNDDLIEMVVQRGNDEYLYEIEDGIEGDFGAEFDQMKYKCCGNKCIFCFVDQNPKELRSSLYFKDEDYRLSFLYGNYVTLTNTSKQNLKRIAEQRLSPLYISVHAINVDVRKKMLGLKGDDHLLEKIKFLYENRIEMHAQVVLCPGINDGPILNETINTLSEFYPYVKTVAVVPVGLTKHRKELFQIKPVDKKLALNIIEWSDKLSQKFYGEFGSNFIYIADEFYLMSGQKLPDAQRYEDFAQIENGVGLTREFLDEFQNDRKSFPKKVKPQKWTVVTGEMASTFFSSEIIPELNKIEGLDVQLKVIKNEFYGGGVTVSGLLVGQDIASQCKNNDLGDVLILPPNCLNYNRLFLDDWDIDKLHDKLDVLIRQPQVGFLELLENI